MNWHKTTLIVLIIVLQLFTLACTFYSFVGGLLGVDGCDIIGGVWEYNPSIDPFCRAPEKAEQLVNDKKDEDIDKEIENQKPNDEPKVEASYEAPEVVGDPSQCAIKGALDLTISDAETNESSTDAMCYYSVDYGNVSDDTIVVYFKQRLDIDGKGTESVWKKYVTLDAGEVETLRYHTTYLKNNEVRYVEVVEAISVITASDECVNTFKHDHDARESISNSILVPCPVE